MSLSLVINRFIRFIGSMGDKFYIILMGIVGVMIPNSDVKDFKKRFDDLQKI